jgi:hypothetical protein
MHNLQARCHLRAPTMSHTVAPFRHRELGCSTAAHMCLHVPSSKYFTREPCHNTPAKQNAPCDQRLSA